MSNQLQQYILTNKQDAILYKAACLVKAAGDDDYERSNAADSIKTMLSCIDSDILAEAYIKKCAFIAGVKTATLAKSIKNDQEEERKKKEKEQHLGEGQSALPKWVDKDRYNNIGFDWRNPLEHPEHAGIYFSTGNGVFQGTNFIMKPIVQIISDDERDRRRITEIRKGNYFHVFEFPSIAFTSTQRFESILMDKGAYHLKDGFGQSHLNKLKAYYLDHYPQGYEITNLGWQEEGFFAFSNVIYQNGVKEYDEYGLVDVGGTKFLSMGASNVLAGLRKGTDAYKNDKHLRYVPAPISFKKWTKLMLEVYGDKAMIGIASCMLAVNRDIVMELTQYCPFPYFYGAAGSGKSKMAESLTALFTMGLRFLNLNQTTIPGFWQTVERFKNVLMGFNEFDANSIDDRLTRAFKGMVENEGRVKAGGLRNKSTTQEVYCLALILGQYLATVDDGAVLGRSLPEKFIERKDYTEQEIEKFHELKTFEKLGITSLSCDLLEHRPYIEKNYQETANAITKRLKADFEQIGFKSKNRAIENYTTVLALVKLYADKMDMAFSYDDFYQYCKNKIINLNTLINETNSLGEFWSLMEHLATNGVIEPGWDYKMETDTELKSMIGEKSSKITQAFDKPTRFLFVRFNSVVKLVSKEKRNISGKTALDENTVKEYLQQQPYYIGAQSSGNFKSKKRGVKTNTSSMVFNYDMLLADGINILEFEDDEETPRVPVSLAGKLQADARVRDNYGLKAMFTLLQDESYQKGDMRVDKLVYTTCFWSDYERGRRLMQDTELEVTGYLSIRHKEDRTFRTMEVTAIRIIRAIEPAEEPDKAAEAGDNQLSIGGDFDPQYTQKPAF